MNRVKNDILMHYGRSVDDGAPGPGSGRYPKGSGEDPNQHSINFAERVQELKKAAWTKKTLRKQSDVKAQLNFGLCIKSPSMISVLDLWTVRWH